MERGLAKIIFFVCACHFLLLAALYLTEGKIFNPALSKNISVKTFFIKEPLAVLPITSSENSKMMPTTSGSIVSSAEVLSTQALSGIEHEAISSTKKSVKTSASSFSSPVLLAKELEKKSATGSSNLDKQSNAPRFEKKEEKTLSSKKKLEQPSEKKKPLPVSSGINSQKIARSKDFPSVKEGNKRESVSGKLIDELQKDLSFFGNSEVTSKKAENLKVPNLSSLEITQFKSSNKEVEKKNSFGTLSSSRYNEGSQEAEFKGLLTDFFKRCLKLPEYGEVKVRMKIKADGSITNVSIVSSKNKKNEEYLKSTLLKIYVPWLNKYLSNQDEADIIVCFTNDF